jgi:hypothetical protein
MRARLTSLAVAGALVAGIAAPATEALAGSHARTAPPRCLSSGLAVWVEKPAGNAALGSRYYFLRFTNLSGHPCTLRGAPGVSAVSLAGRQLGPAAGRTTSGATTQTLAKGATATALLKIGVAALFQGCRPRLAAGLRVFPPGDTAARVVPFPLQTCSRASVMSVGPVGPSMELEIP